MENLGSGCLLHFGHLDQIVRDRPAVDWFEVTSEQLLGSAVTGYKPRIPRQFERLRALYPISLHGLELSIGSVDPLDRRYLRDLKVLARAVEPALMSDHLVWTGAFGYRAHELLPLPYTEDVLAHVAARVSAVQDYLKRPFLLENPPACIVYEHAEMPEWEFMNRLAKKTGCGLILDLNNLYVSCQNNCDTGDSAAEELLQRIDPGAVHQYHLAGYHRDAANGFLFDTHAAPVSDAVWALLARAVEILGPRTVNIEWDSRTPSFEVLHEHANQARVITSAAAKGAIAPDRATTPRRRAPTRRLTAAARPPRVHTQRSIR